MKTILVLSILLYLVPNGNIEDSSEDKITSRESELPIKSKEAKAYCQKNGFNESYCILIDMSMHSGKERLFLWDFKGDSVLVQGLCSHGCGESEWGMDETKTSPIFSNVPDSHCSSLGKYKIGKRGYSQWGININYKLHGLDKTNNNAYKRIIVFHSWDMIPEDPTFPDGAPEGWGCPAVSNKTLKQLDSYLKKSTKPVLLWVYN